MKITSKDVEQSMKNIFSDPISDKLKIENIGSLPWQWPSKWNGKYAISVKIEKGECVILEINPNLDDDTIGKIMSLVAAAPEMFEILEEIDSLVFPENEIDPIWLVWQKCFGKWQELKKKIEGGTHE